MHLDRDLANPEFTRNLLVHQTCRDEAEYFPFTRRQCLETNMRLQRRIFTHATVTIALEPELNRIDKILFAEWFC